MRTLTPTLDRIGDSDDYLGESPVWSDRDQALYWISCEQPPLVHRLDAGRGRRTTWPMPMRVGALAVKAGGGLVVALADGVYDFDPAGGSLTLRAPSPLPSENALHEGRCDRQGRFWVGAYNRSFITARRTGGGAIFLGASLMRWRPDATPDLELKLPLSRPTMLAFGGRDHDVLYLTTGRMLMDAAARAAEPLLGGLYACRAPVRGLAEPECAAAPIVA